MQRRFIALSVIAVLAIVGLFGFNAVAQANFKVGITISLSKIAIGQAYLAK